MSSGNITGRINSIQSMGTLDGPGIRYVVFMQGCNLRCGCCHNPDTWDINQGELVTPQELCDKATRYKSYFGSTGGVTISGGEPLLQPNFVKELFELCHENSINTCLDTSGSILNDNVRSLLKQTDIVLLDIKYTNDEDYLEHAGCSLSKPIEFLNYLEEQGITTTIRQVIIPTLNDNEENICKLKELADKYSCVKNIELLPFKKICKVKYDNLGINFPFEDLPVPTKEKMEELNNLLNK